MCVTRVGRVEGVSQGKARVAFFDGRTLDEVDVSVVGARKGAYVEVFGNLALSLLGRGEANQRKEAWETVRRAAAQEPLAR
jgi:hydrogenase maturation factor